MQYLFSSVAMLLELRLGVPVAVRTFFMLAAWVISLARPAGWPEGVHVGQDGPEGVAGGGAGRGYEVKHSAH